MGAAQAPVRVFMSSRRRQRLAAKEPSDSSSAPARTPSPGPAAPTPGLAVPAVAGSAPAAGVAGSRPLAQEPGRARRGRGWTAPAPGCTATEAGPRQRPQATSWLGRDGAREAAACLRARVAAAAALGPSVPARLQVASRLRGCWPRAARVVVGRGLPRVAHAGARIDLLARGRRGCSWTAFAQCDFHCGRRYDNVYTLVRWRSRPPSWCSDAYKGRVICPFAIIKGGLRPIAIMAMCFATLPVSNNGSQI
jgi:hypothetical protein